MYILILTLSIYNAGLSVTQIGPFATLNACNAAASVWKQANAEGLSQQGHHIESAICANTGASTGVGK